MGIGIIADLALEGAADAVIAGTVEVAATDAAFGAAAGGAFDEFGLNLGEAALGEGIAGAATSAATDAAGGVAANTLGGQAAADTLGSGPATTTGAADSVPSAAKSIANQFVEEGAPATGSGVPADVTTRAEQAFTEGSKQVAAKSNGIIDKFLDWAKANPTAAAITGQVAAGAVGGAGKAAMEAEIAKRNIQARKDLVQQQSDVALNQSRAGTYTGGPGVTPSGSTVLRRPDGTPVYLPSGLINTAMNR